MVERVKFEPTDEQRRMAAAMGGMGATMEDIARVLGVRIDAVRRRLGKEIARGAVEANMKVAQSLFEMAVGKAPVIDPDGKVLAPGRDPIPAAAMFWCKTRLKWTYPKTEVEIKATLTDELAELTDAQLVARYEEVNARIARLVPPVDSNRADASDKAGTEPTDGLPSVH